MRVSYLIIFILSLLLLITGYLLFKSNDLFQIKERESSEVLLEDMARVFKLVAVEGRVSEIYDYKQYRYWDLPFLRKQALVRVKAKVSVGYDFNNVEFIVDEKNYTISIKDFPKAEILSVDHELDYYNLQEGVFNTFTAEELSLLNKKAKNFIVDIIHEGPLIEEAEAQKAVLIDLLKSIFEKTGWNLKIDDSSFVLPG